MPGSQISVELAGRAISRRSLRARGGAGFSLLEMLIIIGIILVVSAFALPSLSQAWNSYELTNRATQVADMIKWARSSAIKRNNTANVVVDFANGIVGDDADGDNNLDPGEPEIILTSGFALLPDGVAPDPSSMTIYPNAPQQPAGSPALIPFDSRGAVTGPNALNVTVLYVGLAGQPQYGFRAITLLPSGNTDIWAASQGGTWQRLN